LREENDNMLTPTLIITAYFLISILLCANWYDDLCCDLHDCTPIVFTFFLWPVLILIVVGFGIHSWMSGEFESFWEDLWKETRFTKPKPPAQKVPESLTLEQAGGYYTVKYTDKSGTVKYLTNKNRKKNFSSLVEATQIFEKKEAELAARKNEEKEPAKGRIVKTVTF
jgi:hypothetical protein